VSLISCVQFSGREEKDGKPFTVKRIELFGLTAYEDSSQVLNEKELAQDNAAIIATAEAEAKAKTSLFKINAKQDREDMKRNTAKILSWACFIGALIAVVMGVMTEGYKKWGTMAAVLFVCGMLALLIPELIIYLKWVVIGLGALGIVLGLSHTKYFSIAKHKARPGTQAITDKEG
jgi:hypothetical protein